MEIPRIEDDSELVSVELAPGSATVFLGANGTGKTRLGVYLEEHAFVSGHQKTYRIAAHRSLALNDSVQITSLAASKASLNFGDESFLNDHQQSYVNRLNNKWVGNPATAMQKDFDHLIRTLFAEENEIGVRFLYSAQSNGLTSDPPQTVLMRVLKIWQMLLPHRQIYREDGRLFVRVTSSRSNSQPYLASGLSDGERAIFFLLAQCLLVDANTALIIDEPESNTHRSLLEPLWNVIELERQDCAIVYITHDVDFAASRRCAKKYALQDYQHPQKWKIVRVDPVDGIPENIVNQIVGIRRPILFIESTNGTFESKVYSSLCPEETVIPVGSCEAVSRYTSSLSGVPMLHRFAAKGIVDLDYRSEIEVQNLSGSGVRCTCVAEFENVFAIKAVFLSVAEVFLCQEPEKAYETLVDGMFLELGRTLSNAICEVVRFRIDRAMKMISLSSENFEKLSSDFSSKVAAIDVKELYAEFQQKFEDIIRNRDLDAMLALRHDKGVIARVAGAIGLSKKSFIDKVLVLLAKKTESNDLRDKLSRALNLSVN